MNVKENILNFITLAYKHRLFTKALPSNLQHALTHALFEQREDFETLAGNKEIVFLCGTHFYFSPDYLGYNVYEQLSLFVEEYFILLYHLRC